MIQLLLQVGGTATLARLLSPRDFGLVAMVTAISILGMILRDAGLSMATVQAPRITQDQCAMLFRVNAAAGVLLGGFLAAAAPLVARFYGHEELTWITLGFAAPLALSGFVTQHFALLQRNMMFGAVTLCQIGVYSTYWLGAIVSALQGLGYWSLVIGNAASYFAWLILVFVFCRWIPSRPAKGTGVRSFLRFGGHVLGSQVVNYFSSNADTILVGRFLGAGPVGLYTRACNFIALPVSQIRDLIMRVGLPVLRVLVDEPERYRRYQMRLTNVVVTVSLPLGLICILDGGFFVQALLGRQWLEATTAFRVFGAVMVIRPVLATVELALLSLGESRRYLTWSLVTSGTYVASFAAGLPWGISGVAAAYATANFALLLPGAVYCLGRSPVTLRDFLRQFVVPLGLGCVAGAVVLVFHAAAGYAFVDQGIGVVLFVVAYCGLSVARPSIRELIHPLWGALRPRRG